MLSYVPGCAGFAALIVRTDHADEAAWRAVAEDLGRPWGRDGDFEPVIHLLDDPAWAGATPDQVLAAVGRDEELSVVFVADRTTMTSPHRALLALRVGADEEDEDLDPEYYRDLVDAPPACEFRTVPAGVHDVHANLSIANMDFQEYAEAAAEDPEGVFRGF
ncbi:hypothetical protein ACFCV9_06785 [Streptomyces sp. NPDC056367]|uniref:DUF6924 domain-containing protein n=1 Tax=unclassified Streptomyces TaxID=2593676 RepID=UPI0035E002D7